MNHGGGDEGVTRFEGDSLYRVRKMWVVRGGSGRAEGRRTNFPAKGREPVIS